MTKFSTNYLLITQKNSELLEDISLTDAIELERLTNELKELLFIYEPSDKVIRNILISL